jgi:hypothetical protein
MSVSASVTESPKTLTSFLIFLELLFTGNYVTGGDTLNLETIPQSTAGCSNFIEPPATIEVIGQNLGGYTAAIVPSPNLTGYKVQIFNGDTQLAAGAYPAAVLAGHATVLATRRAV